MLGTGLTVQSISVTSSLLAFHYRPTLFDTVDTLFSSVGSQLDYSGLEQDTRFELALNAWKASVLTANTNPA